MFNGIFGGSDGAVCGDGMVRGPRGRREGTPLEDVYAELWDRLDDGREG